MNQPQVNCQHMHYTNQHKQYTNHHRQYINKQYQQYITPGPLLPLHRFFASASVPW